MGFAETEDSNKTAVTFNGVTDRWENGVGQVHFSDYVNKTWHTVFEHATVSFTSYIFIAVNC